MKEDLPTEEDAHGILLKLHAIDAQGLAESEVTQLPDGWAFSTQTSDSMPLSRSFRCWWRGN